MHCLPNQYLLGDKLFLIKLACPSHSLARICVEEKLGSGTHKTAYPFQGDNVMNLEAMMGVKNNFV